jgi:hypothetical protein
MISIPHQPLPLATTSAFTPAAHAPREQGADWQRHFDAARSTVACASTEPVTALPLETVPPHHPGECRPRGAQAATVVAPSPGGIAPSAFAMDAPAARVAPSPWLHIAAAEPVLPEAASELPEASRPPDHAQAPRPQPAVRVHMQETAQGLSLWLGVDGDAATVAARAAALLPELRRHLETATQRITQVVCNGRPIYRSPGSIEEKT